MLHDSASFFSTVTRFINFDARARRQILMVRAGRRSSGVPVYIRPSAASFMIAAGAIAFAAASAHAQISYTTTTRNGQNLAVCGLPGSGNGINHRFSTFDPTHDPIAVSDPGDGTRPASNATAVLDASFTPSRIDLADAGSAHRGSLPTNGNGVYATADGRDACEFTLSASTRFRLTVTMHAATTEGNNSVQTFLFIPLGAGQIVLDNGASGGLSHAIVASGDWTATYTGTLSAGAYSIELTGRTDGGSAYPFTGSFGNSLSLVVNYCGADFDADGFLTGDDFDLYVAAFEQGDPTADFNGDGFVTGEDFDALVEAFEAGC